MKTSPLLATLLVLGAFPLMAQTNPAPASSPTPPPAITPAAKPAVKTTKPVEKKVEEEKLGVIEGIAIARAGGNWLGITTAGNQFKVTFYDKKKKPEAPDVVRGTARWNHPRKVGEENTVLNPSGPNALATPTLLKPPYVYTVRFTLIGADGAIKESHAVQLKPGANGTAPDAAAPKP
jgi:hypothetical protein